MQGYRYPRIPAYLCTLNDCIQLTDCMIVYNNAIVYTSASCGLCAWYRIACVLVCLFSCARLVFRCVPVFLPCLYSDTLQGLQACASDLQAFFACLCWFGLCGICVYKVQSKAVYKPVKSACLAFSLVCVFDTVN